jgi:hypothetical protein
MESSAMPSAMSTSRSGSRHSRMSFVGWIVCYRAASSRSRPGSPRRRTTTCGSGASLSLCTLRPDEVERLRQL